MRSKLAGWGITPRGRSLVLAASILFGLLAIVPDNAIPSVLAVASFLLFFLYVSKIVFEFKVRTASNLVVERVIEPPVVEDKDTTIRVVIKNDSPVPIEGVEIVDFYPETFKLIKGSNKLIGFVPGKGTLIFEYIVKPVVGRHLFEKTLITVRDPAGLFSKKITAAEKQEIFVQPRYEEIKGTSLITSNLYAPGGRVSTRKRGIGIQFIETREYVPGDDYRFIEWKSTARTGKLMVKELEHESSLDVVLILDNSRTMVMGLVSNTKFEYMLRGTASIARYLIRRGDSVGLAYSVPNGYRFVKPGRGPGQYRKLVKALSEVPWPTSEYTLPDLDELVRQTILSLTKRTKRIFIIFSDLETDPGLLEKYVKLLDKLKANRNEVIIISPYTPYFEVIGLEGLQASIYRILTTEAILKREEVVRELLKHGITVVNVGPNDFVSKTLMRIEAIRQRLG